MLTWKPCATLFTFIFIDIALLNVLLGENGEKGHQAFCISKVLWQSRLKNCTNGIMLYVSSLGSSPVFHTAASEFVPPALFLKFRFKDERVKHSSLDFPTNARWSSCRKETVTSTAHSLHVATVFMPCRGVAHSSPFVRALEPRHM